MKIGLGIGIPFIRNYVSSIVFDPSKLFTGSTNGVWYDPSDINLTWRRNLLTYTEQFDNAAWVKNNATVTVNATTAPDGSATAEAIVPVTTGFSATQFFNIAGTYTASVSVKDNGAGSCLFAMGSNTIGYLINVNLTTGAYVSGRSYGGGTLVSYSIVSQGSGWWRVTVTATASVGGILIGNADGTTPSSGIYIWGAQLELGSAATPYQRITDGIQDYLQYQAQPVLYRDAAGTLPVTAVEQPVGLMLDKSKGLVLGPELVTNGGFDTNVTGWTLADSAASINWVSGGYANVKMLTNTGSGARQDVALASGWAKVSIRARKVGTSGNIRLVLHGYGAFTTTLGDILITSQSFQNYDFVVPATNGGFRIYLKVEFSGAEMEVDSVSVRELPGNHAFNSSGNSANFPVLSARYNLLTKTEQFDDAVWTKSNATVTSNAVTSPDGTNTADALIENNANGFHQTSTTSVITSVAGTHVLSVYAKANQRNYVYLNITSGGIDNTALFDLTTGNYSGYFTGGVVASSYSSQNVGNGWWKVSITVTTTAATLAPAIGIRSTTGNFSSGYTGDGTSGIYIWGADLRVANDALNQPAYQRVNTSTDYDTVGFKPYLLFNGTNQWLQTNSIDFTYGDKMFVSAGVRKLQESGASAQFICELSADSGANNGSFYLTGWNGYQSPNHRYAMSSRGTASATSAEISASYAAPITNVISGIVNISGDQAILRVNGSQAAISSTDQGTGNYGNYPLYIGARAGTSLWFNGRLYGMVVAGKQASAVEIENTENYLEVKTFGKDMQYVYSDPLLTAASEQITTAGGEDIYLTVTYQ